LTRTEKRNVIHAIRYDGGKELYSKTNDVYGQLGPMSSYVSAVGNVFVYCPFELRFIDIVFLINFAFDVIRLLHQCCHRDRLVSIRDTGRFIARSGARSGKFTSASHCSLRRSTVTTAAIHTDRVYSRGFYIVVLLTSRTDSLLRESQQLCYSSMSIAY